jgi:hypothetical protein
MKQAQRSVKLVLALAVQLAIRGVATGQSFPPSPPHDAGSGVTGAYEGWFANSDGSFSLLLGYFNRNQKQELDVPVGPNNKIEPGGPDRGQPTHFLPGRQWGLFVVKVPRDFGTQKVTWTLVANGQTTILPVGLNPDYEISPLVEASGNTPAVLNFERVGPSVQGPAGLHIRQKARVGDALTITAWVSDDGKTGKGSVINRKLASPVTVFWTKYRGPGEVSFADDRPRLQRLPEKEAVFPVEGKFETTARFSQPGEYVLHLEVNDLTGDGGAGFQCCWTNGFVDVTVQP